MTAAVLFGVWLTALTEIWGSVPGFGIFGLRAGWICAGAGAAAMLLMPGVRRFFAGALTGTRSVLNGTPRFILILMCMLGFLILCTALISGPNNYDAMTYRIPRVYHWIQQESLKNFATSNLRQLQYNPWVEFVYLNLKAIFGTDRSFGLLQFGAWAGVLVTSSLIYKELVPEGRMGWLAAVLSGTLPMAVLQASSVQTDLTAAFWASAAVYYLLVYRRTGSMLWLITGAAAVGLACLTKVTSYLFLAPFAVWGSWLVLRRPPRDRWRHLMAAVLLVAAINAGHVARSYDLNGSLFKAAPFEPHVYHNETLDPRMLILNVARNYVSHFQVPSEPVTRSVERAVRAMHRWVGVDPDDQRFTANKTFFISRQNLFEDTAGNPLHAVLLLAGLAVCLCRPRSLALPTWAYAACFLAGFALLAFALKWQVWGVRFHLTFFVLAAPWLAHVIASFGGELWSRVIGLGLVVLAFVWALLGGTRSWVGEVPIYRQSASQSVYNSGSQFKRDFERLVLWVQKSGVRRVGLAFGPNDWEYPMWARLDEVRIEHVHVSNASARYQDKAFIPEAVLYSNGFLTAHRDRLQEFLGGRRLIKLDYFVLALEPVLSSADGK